MHKGKIFLTDAQKKWTHEKITQLGRENLTLTKVRELKIAQEWKQMSGRDITDMGMCTRLRAYAGLNKKGFGGNSIFTKGSWILFSVMLGDPVPFNSQEELTAYLERNDVSNPIVFKQVNAQVKKSVTIG